MNPSRFLARRWAHLLLAAAFLHPAIAHTGGPVLVVTKTADTADGACDADCSLREAILAANGVAGPSAIHFAIPSEGEPVTIAPASELPAITSPVVIDGATQPGASCSGLALAVSLDGSGAGAGAVGLRIAAPDSSVRGIAIHSFGDSGIIVSAPGATIACNRIGTDALGSGGSGNQGTGILIDSASNTLVGGAAPNAIRDNQGGGVWVFGQSALRNRISQNAMSDNAGEGIDLLGLDFEDPIDPGDPDEGPNRLQNSPEIASAVLDVETGELAVAYRVDSDPMYASYPITVEFFRTDDLDEGAAFLGTATFAADDYAAGAPVTAAFVPADEIAVDDSILATATDAEGNTSEFPALATLVVPEPGAAGSALAASLALAWQRWRRAAVITSV